MNKEQKKERLTRSLSRHLPEDVQVCYDRFGSLPRLMCHLYTLLIIK